MAGRITFPYESMGEALKDRFRRIGGIERAFRCLRRGYLELKWRENTTKRAKARPVEEDFTVRRRP